MRTLVMRHVHLASALMLAVMFASPAQGAARDPWAIDWLSPAAPDGPREPVLRLAADDFLHPAAEGAAYTGSTWRIASIAETFAPLAPGTDATPGEPARPRLRQDPQGTTERPRAARYSHGYEVRRTIHVYASMTTIPLFVTQAILGQKLYDNPTDGVRTAHQVVAGSIAGLFGINTVTGVWNLIEARKDPDGRKRRLTHGLLMLSADAGFLATGLLAPDDEGGGNRGRHRAVALTSIGIATAGYVFMLLTR